MSGAITFARIGPDEREKVHFAPFYEALNASAVLVQKVRILGQRKLVAPLVVASGVVRVGKII
jgi:hypothetical protein